jgi:hypothetical protein
MTDNEIIGGLKNAIERGQSLDKAVQTFINAGYNPRLVQEAATQLSSGVTQIINPSPSSDLKSKFPIYQPVIQTTPNNIIQPNKENELEGNKKKIVIGLILTFTILIAILIVLIIFKEKILTYFG